MREDEGLITSVATGASIVRRLRAEDACSDLVLDLLNQLTRWTLSPGQQTCFPFSAAFESFKGLFLLWNVTRQRATSGSFKALSLYNVFRLSSPATFPDAPAYT